MCFALSRLHASMRLHQRFRSPLCRHLKMLLIAKNYNNHGRIKRMLDTLTEMSFMPFTTLPPLENACSKPRNRMITTTCIERILDTLGRAEMSFTPFVYNDKKRDTFSIIKKINFQFISRITLY